MLLMAERGKLVIRDLNAIIHVCRHVGDYFIHKLTFLPNKQLTEIKTYLSLGRRSKANFNSHVFCH